MKTVSRSCRVPVFRFGADTRGQVLLLGIIVLTVILGFLFLLPNATRVTTRKVQTQTAADIGALTGSVWLARALNLNAHLNIGIRSIYSWITILTAGQALALALYSDTLDPSVMALGRQVTEALFDNPDPVYTARNIYPQAISRLAEAAQWLSTIQDDIAEAFPRLASISGSAQACRNVAGTEYETQTAGGRVLVASGESLLFCSTVQGDSLLHIRLSQVARLICTIPTNDSNIGPATGIVTVDPRDYEVKAYYSDSSNWVDLVQVLAYQKYIMQYYYNPQLGIRDSGAHFFRKPGGKIYTAFLQGDTWVKYWYPHPGPWYWDGKQVGDNRYKRDTVITRQRFIKVNDPRWDSIRNVWTYHPWQPGRPILPEAQPIVDEGDIVDSSYFVKTGFFTGAESTNGAQGPKLSPRRPNPDRNLYTVAYTWQSNTPAVHPGMPMLTIARAEPYLAVAAPDEEDYLFKPAWDIRLTPLDSSSLELVTNDSVFNNRGLSVWDLQELRRYVLLP